MYQEVAGASRRALGDNQTEASLEDFKRFEHVRRRSESAIDLLCTKSREHYPGETIGLSTNMQKLTLVEESSRENERE